MWPIVFSVFHVESKHLYEKESLSCLCCLFCLFWSVFFFLKVFWLLFFIKDSIFGIFCLHFLRREKNISQLFICKHWCFSSHFPCQLCPLKHWSLKSCRFFLFWFHKKSHECDPSELPQSSFRTKTVWKVAGVFRRKNEMFSKNFLNSSKGNPFSFFFLKFRQSGAKIVRLIAKEWLSAR